MGGGTGENSGSSGLAGLLVSLETGGAETAAPV